MKKLFGKHLKELRLKRGFTQEKISEIININTDNYSRIENGLSFPKPENLVKLAKVLNVELSELFQFKNYENIEQIINDITQKLKTDNETAMLTYKFLKSLGKL